MSEDGKLAAAKLTAEQYARVIELSKADYRTLSDELRWLIDQEWERRQKPCTLIDAPKPYRTEAVGE